jgi:hypothetical protein
MLHISLALALAVSLAHASSDLSDQKESVAPRRAHPGMGSAAFEPFASAHAPARAKSDGRPNAGFAPPAAKVEVAAYRDSIRSQAEFEAQAIQGDGLVRGGRAMKLVIDKRDERAPKVYFINSNAPSEDVKFHFDFTHRYLDPRMPQSEFDRTTYFTRALAERSFIAGTIQSYEVQVNGRAEHFFGLQFYPQDLIHDEMIAYAVRAVRARFEVPGQPLQFVSQGSQQTMSSAVLQQLGTLFQIKTYTIDQILGATRYLPMNAGEAWGYLRVFPKDPDSLEPSDIPVFNELPLDLSVVAGTATFSIQNPGSHINLKSKERGTPNFVLHDLAAIEKLRVEFDGRPVHLVVAEQEFRVEASTEAEVRAALDRKLSRKWKKIVPGRATEIVFYDRMCPASAGACIRAVPDYGGKAAKLGFLNHDDVLGARWARGAGFAYPLTSDGFAVPTSFYRALLAANPALKTELDALVALELKGALTSAERGARALKVRELFYVAKIPDAEWAKLVAAAVELRARVLAAYPDLKGPNGKGKFKIKVRSSANAEDIPDFDGAGLHDSFAANLNKSSSPGGACAIEHETEGLEVKAKMDPNTFACAIKGVYASLWNKRAIEERTFKRIDHSTAAMGLAIVPGYDLLEPLGLPETGNSVVVTRVINSSVYGYTVASQLGDNLVTNPTPGTQAEVAIATFVEPSEPVGLTYTQFAQPTPDAPLRSDGVFAPALMQTIVDLARHVEQAYCRNKPGYYALPSRERPDCDFVVVDNAKPKSLDMEFKVLGDGKQLICKQVREFGGK